jgi:predicted NAD/FAD-binding protein
MCPTVAVIGSGVGSLTAAHILGRERHVTLYEADARLGGHTHTHRVGDGQLPVDSGFIVHNVANYPLLTRLFNEIGVSTRGSEMSMSVSCAGCGLRYVSGSTLRTVPGRPSSVDRLTWRQALAEIERFNGRIGEVLAEPAIPLTLGELLEEEGYSEYFVRHLVLPMVCAVWSCGPCGALRYPARYLFRFLANHGLLHGSTATRWRTVVGGSADYVRRIVAGLPEVRPATRVTAVTRVAGGLEVTDENGRSELFGAAVIGVHPADALALRTDPSREEQETLSAIGYVPSEVLLHTDSRLLPEAAADRASWNYWQGSCDASDTDVSISYHLNRLQGLPTGTDYVVTLNATDRVAPDRVLAAMRYEHPLYTTESLRAQGRLPALNSSTLAYAGAYHGWGFHEDGCRSGVAAARAVGVSW